MQKRLFFWAIILSLFIGSSAYAARMEDAVIGRLTLDGETISGVKRLQMDSSNKVLLASGTTVPTDGTSGYAKGCIFIDTDVGTGICGRYENMGLSTSCKFRVTGNQIVELNSATAIATTGTTTVYVTAPGSRNLTAVNFAGSQGHGSSSTNYITFQITNLGQNGAGTQTLLHGSCTTKGTDVATAGLGGIGTDTVYPLTLTGTTSSLSVTKGDRLKLNAVVTGTLTNTITLPSWMLTFAGP